MTNARLRQSLSPIWRQIIICKIKGKGVPPQCAIVVWSCWKIFIKDEENRGLHWAHHQDHSPSGPRQRPFRCKSRKYEKLRKPCLVSGLVPPLPTQLLANSIDIPVSFLRSHSRRPSSHKVQVPRLLLLSGTFRRPVFHVSLLSWIFTLLY